jgi:NAD(P)-dependent dehydrogenase (short-subunit alcohol dehydrogenase family)
MNLTGKVALITGASRGIGAETARVFAAAGARVVLAARSEGEISEIAAEIGDGALAVRCDVAKFDDVRRAVDAAVSSFGSLDILVNNAGVIEPISHLATSDPENWGHAIDINLKGVYYGIRAAIPIMRRGGGGSILTVSSGAAYHPIEAWSHYCASKAGVAMLTRCANAEEAQHGIRVMGLSPGTVATKMQREIKASGINAVSELDWSDHIAPDWPARALLWMCGPEADEFLGQDVNLREDDIRKRAGLIE